MDPNYLNESWFKNLKQNDKNLVNQLVNAQRIQGDMQPLIKKEESSPSKLARPRFLLKLRSALDPANQQTPQPRLNL